MEGKHLDSKTEWIIKTLSKEGYSCSVIVKKLAVEGIHTSKATVSRVITAKGKGREAAENGSEFNRERTRTTRTKQLIARISRLATSENPPSQRQIARTCKTSSKTVNKVIHEGLQLTTRRKTDVHKLNATQMQNRKRNLRKLYERHLAGDKWEYVVSLDEAWIYLSYCNGTRKICYVKRGCEVPEEWLRQCDRTFPAGFMVVGIISGRGTLPLIQVPGKVKINNTFYIEYVLKPVIEELKVVYQGETDKVFIHHDKASSHTSKKTREFLEHTRSTIGIKFIQNSEIPVKSPDASPLDFFGFGYLKQRLFKRRATTIDGLWKVCQEEWQTITVETIKKVFAAWKKRCRMVVRRQGKHIEQFKQIHSRKVPC